MAAPGTFLVPVLLLFLCGPDPCPACLLLAGVECIFFNEEYMTCMWGSRETVTVNYSLYYWYKNASEKVECKHYLQNQGVRIGCYFNKSELIQFQPFHVLVNASVGGKSLEIPSKRMELQDQVKPGVPINLTMSNMSNNQLQLTWATPYSRPNCLEHAVKYKSNKDTSWTELSVNGYVFSLPSVDYEKYYTFYVRSKINQFCGKTQLWSEWSVPVVWGSNSSSKGPPAGPPHCHGVMCCLGVSVTLAFSRHSGGTAALVWDPDNLGPYCLLPPPAGPCHPAGAHGKGMGHPDAPNSQSHSSHPALLPGGMGWSPQRCRGELQPRAHLGQQQPPTTSNANWPSAAPSHCHCPCR
uniref:Cytokine receptor common subunit gamma n=1 Tax=Malurus cyaneus samueli TaxID=2593467 RepID=A0A8C5UG12_9PASS